MADRHSRVERLNDRLHGDAGPPVADLLDPVVDDDVREFLTRRCNDLLSTDRLVAGHAAVWLHHTLYNDDWPRTANMADLAGMVTPWMPWPDT